MNFLQDEIERKRKAMQSFAQKTGISKYAKRGDLERMREEQYLIEQRETELLRQEKRQKLEQLTKPEINQSILSDRIEPISIKAIDETFNVDDIIKRLRLRGQPIKMFAETDQERILRLKGCEVNEIRASGQTSELRALLLAGEKGLTEDLLKGLAPSKPIKEEVHKDAEVDTTQISLDLLKSNQKLITVLIAIYFKRVTTEWAIFLSNRSDEVKRSVDGKLKTALQAQTVIFMKPLYKRLKKATLDQE
jgi:pre-mRNA-splicing factor 18